MTKHMVQLPIHNSTEAATLIDQTLQPSLLCLHHHQLSQVLVAFHVVYPQDKYKHKQLMLSAAARDAS